MKITPALEREMQRQDAVAFTKIALHKDGKFYHVYEVSAWLLKTQVCTEEMQRGRGDAKMLAVSRYVSRKGEYVMAGFPLESVAKYVPTYVNVETSPEGDLTFTIAMPESFAGRTADELCAEFDEWKKAQPAKERQRSVNEVRRGDNTAAALARSGVFNIMTDLLSYPIELRTQQQNTEFLSELKQKIVALL